MPHATKRSREAAKIVYVTPELLEDRVALKRFAERAMDRFFLKEKYKRVGEVHIVRAIGLPAIDALEGMIALRVSACAVEQ